MQAAIGCLVLALLCLVVSWVRCRKPKAPAKEVPLISVESTGACRGRVALIHTGSALPESALVKHIRRLLLERGFSEVRCATKPAELVEGCRGANLGIDLAVSHCHFLYQFNGGVFLPPWGKSESWTVTYASVSTSWASAGDPAALFS
jgi:hypothetical protein